MIVAILVAVLVAPFFIDWSSHKTVFEREASRLLGHPVRVRGDADAQILPIPSFTFTDIEVGQANNAPIMSAAGVKVRVELIPLLQSEIEVIDMELDRPQMNVRIDRDGNSNWILDDAQPMIGDAFAVKLGPVTIREGGIYFANEAQNVSVRLSDIDATVRAQSLLGPWKAEGRASEETGAFSFKIGTGKLEDGIVRVKTALEPDDLPFNASFDGKLAFRDEDGMTIFPRYEGIVNLAEIEAVEHGGEDQAQRTRKPDGWTLEGAYKLSREAFLLSQANFIDGARDAPLNLTGALRVPFSEDTRFDALISSRQIDLDRTYGKGPTEPVNLGEAGAAVVNVLKGLPKPPVPGEIGFDIPGIVVGGDVIRSVHFDATPTETGWHIENFGALLPGATQLRFDGDVALDDEAGLEGRFDIVSERPVAFARWWRPTESDAIRRLRVGDYAIRGRLGARSSDLDFTDLDARIGESDFSGTVSVARLTSDDKRFDADLAAKRLDFDALKVLSALFVGDSNVSGFGRGDTVTVKIAADAFVAEAVEGRKVNLDLRIADGEIDINDLRIEDFAGLKVDAAGNIGNLLSDPEGRFSGNISAQNTAGLIKFGDAFFPGHPALDYLRRHGSALMPLDVEVNFSGVETDDAKLKSDIAATIAGTVGVGTVKAGLRFQGGTEAPLSGEVEASLEADYENTADLLKQLGWSMVDLGETGSAQLNLTANGIPQDGVVVAIDATLSGVGLTAQQKVSFSEDYMPTYRGDFRLKSEDTEPLARSLGYAFPAMGLGTPVDVSGTLSGDGWSGKVSGLDGRVGRDNVKADLAYEGKAPGISDAWHWTGSLSTERLAVPWFMALVTGEVIVPEGLALEPTEAQSGTDKQPSVWPQRVFGKPYYSGLSADLEIEANEAVFGDAHKVQKPRFKLRLRPSVIGLSELAGRFGNGTIEGRVLIQNMEGEVSLSGLVSLNGASAGEVLWNDGVRPLVDGRLTITSQFEGVGRSLEAVMATLGGGGSLQLDDARIRRLNPSAFGLLTEAADRELTLDDDTVKPLVNSHLDAGHLKVEEAVAPFTISSGALRIAETSFETQSDVETLEAFAGATLNLVDLTVDGSLALNVSSVALDDEPVSGAAPEIAVLFKGPLDTPERSLDIQPLLGYLTVRRFEQEVRRVEILQADILEKQRLSRYARWVSAEEAREQREAEEAERLRLLEEERRQEEERLQEEARAAEEARLLREAEERAAEVERVRLEREALQRALAEEEEQRRQAEAVAEEAARKRAEALERIGRQQSGSNLTGVNERPWRAPAQSRERRLPPVGAPLELRPLAR